MRRAARAGAALALLAALLATVAGTAAANPDEDAQIPIVENPRVVDLRVNGGAEGWSATDSFNLDWGVELPPATAPSAVVAVRYRLFDPGMNTVLRQAGLPGSARTLQNLRIPAPAAGLAAVPGTYPIQIWAEGANAGPVALALLRFDDRRPGNAVPRLPDGWTRGDVEPVLRIEPPPGPQPHSGIRGYAISVRRDAPGPPCEGPNRCSLAETDLGGGIDDHTLSLGLLPEGVHVATVVAVSNSGMRSPEPESAVIRVDATRPDIALSGSGGGWSNRPVRVVARATDALSGMVVTGPTGPRTSIAIDGGVPTVAQGDEVATVVAGSGVHSVAAGARDAAGNARGENDASPPVTGVVRIDEAPPAVVFIRSGGPEEPELLEAAVSDPLSGPAPRGGSIGVRPLGSNLAFEPIPTTNVGGRLTARWDSDSFPHGSYEFRATGLDRAGNATSSARRADGALMVLANPVKVPAAVRFGFGGRRLVWHRCVRRGESRRCRREVIASFARRPAKRVVPYRQGLRVGGRLVAASGAPLPNHAVDLVESFDAGATTRPRITRVRTGVDGAFVARLRPGPSRRVEARFGGTRVLTRAEGRSLRLAVRTSLRLRASSSRAVIGGRPVVFSGRVGQLDAAIPSYGRPVQFQFRLPGSRWTEFRTVQTDEQGRFSFPYSFSDNDSRGVRFLFRAFAPQQPGWPYEPAASKPVAVTGY